ncbi:MAG: hypothetical protein ACJ79O_12640, partial [Myxococcales bacterium]
LFLIDYQLHSAVACYQFPHPRPVEYFPFAGLIVLRPLGLGHVVPGAAVYGVAGFIFAVGLAVTAALRALRRDRTLRSRTVFLFSGFSLAFVVATAVGRVCLGTGAAFASRYVAYLLPLWLAAYFLVLEQVAKRPSLRRPAAVAVALLVALQALPKDKGGLRWYSEGKSRWRSCYLETKDESGCNRATGFRVYPVEGAPQVTQMLVYLREHHLNLFK